MLLHSTRFFNIISYAFIHSFIDTYINIYNITHKIYVVFKDQNENVLHHVERNRHRHPVFSTYKSPMYNTLVVKPRGLGHRQIP